MKHKLNNKSGFTLIEVIIVVIILGVLAGLALPRVVAQINRAYSAEAVNQLGSIVRAIDACVAGRITGGTTQAQNLTALNACDEYTEIGIAQPGGLARFIYGGTVAAPQGTAANPWPTAAVAPIAGVAQAGNTITLNALFLSGPVNGAGVTLFDAVPSAIQFVYDAVAGGVPVANKTSAGVFGGIQWQ